jgi:hypothetical protein
MAIGSRAIVQNWANLPGLPHGADDIKALWAGSGNPQAADWNAGATYLADQLRPNAQPGQKIDYLYIEGLNPCTVDELAAELGW